MKETGKNNTKTKKVWSIVGTVLLYLFLFFLIISLVIAIVAKKGDRDGVEIFGHQMSIVLTGSMEKCDKTDVSAYKIKDIPVDSLIWIETVPKDPDKAEQWYADIKVGDVLTFKYVYVTQETITHRVVDIYEKATGGYIITLEGDNKNDDSGVLQQIIDTSDADSYNYVIGKVTGKSLFFGKLFKFISSKVGLIFIVLIPSIIIIVLEAINIYGIVTKGKKDKAQEEARQKDEEIANLKKMLKEEQDKNISNTSVDEINDEKDDITTAEEKDKNIEE